MAAPVLHPAPAPLCLFRWKCSDPALEVRILQTGQNAILQLYNTARAEIADAANYNADHSIARLRSCVQYYKRDNWELRLFENGNLGEINGFLVELGAKKITLYVWTHLTQDQIERQKTGASPSFSLQNQVWICTLQPFEPINPPDRWENAKGKSEVGVARTEPDGFEEELVRLDFNQGVSGAEEIRVIRRKTPDGRDSIVCELVHRILKSRRTLQLVEDHPERAISSRVIDIQQGTVVNLTYSRNDLPEAVAFLGERVTEILFAEERDLRKISLSEVSATALEYLKGTDASGKGLKHYNIRSLSVKKLIDQSGLGRKPIIHIHLERNSAIKTVKPICAWIESFLNIGDAELYVDPIQQPLMEDLVLRNPMMDQQNKKMAWQEFKMAFTRCGKVDIKIACDRTWGELVCDDQTWTLRAAQHGARIRNILVRPAPDEPPRQRLPYVTPGAVGQRIEEI